MGHSLADTSCRHQGGRVDDGTVTALVRSATVWAGSIGVAMTLDAHPASDANGRNGAAAEAGFTTDERDCWRDERGA